jgi:hypothetical protein
MSLALYQAKYLASACISSDALKLLISSSSVPLTIMQMKISVRDNPSGI